MVKNSSSELLDKYFSKVRNTFPEAFLSDDKLKEIFLACSSEEELQTIIHYLGLSLKSNPNHKKTGQLLFESVDCSEYQLDQWITAIHFFHNWITNEGRKTTFEKMLGYIQCCTDSPENKTFKYALKDILKDMIDTYGYNG